MKSSKKFTLIRIGSACQYVLLQSSHCCNRKAKYLMCFRNFQLAILLFASAHLVRRKTAMMAKMRAAIAKVGRTRQSIFTCMLVIVYI